MRHHIRQARVPELRVFWANIISTKMTQCIFRLSACSDWLLILPVVFLAAGCQTPNKLPPGANFDWRASEASPVTTEKNAQYYSVSCVDFPISGTAFSKCLASDVYIAAQMSSFDCYAYQNFSANSPKGQGSMPILHVYYTVSRRSCGSYSSLNLGTYYKPGFVIWTDCTNEGVQNASAATCNDRLEVVRLIQNSTLLMNGRSATLRTYELSGKRTVWLHEIVIHGDTPPGRRGPDSWARIRIYADPVQGSYQDAILAIGRSITFDRSIVR